jgi:hypothetical protein
MAFKPVRQPVQAREQASIHTQLPLAP